MQRVRFYLRAVAGAAGFVAAVLYLVGLRLLRGRRSTSRGAFARTMGRLTCAGIGVRVRPRHRERMHLHHPCVFVANHQSYVDYAIMGNVFPASAVVMARQVGDLPLLGWLFRDTGNIVVDRDVPLRAAAALDDAEHAIRERDVSVWIFPEGTRGAGTGRLGPFRRGAFRLAIATGAPIVPVVASPLKPHIDLRGRRLDPHEVELRVLEPVPVAGLTDADEERLRHHVHALMQAALDDMAGRSAAATGAA
jgi:1-acyl-sn-glycerol-3-phosphate acyltransferase